MGKFTVIPQDTFEGLQLDAGVLLKRFDPASPYLLDEDIICATTGGINASCVPTYSDLGEDVDNCPVNMKELKHLDSWEAKLSFTSLGTSKEGIRLALGAADIEADTGAIRPRKDLAQTDFSDVWWVGDRADEGFVAIQLKNALSTAGFTLQTTKAGKGQTSVELTGHVSINAQSEMPMVFYSMGPSVLSEVKISPVAGTEELFETEVSDLQKDIDVTASQIRGTLHFFDDDSSSIVTNWGEGNFLALQFDNLDPNATSVKVGLRPTYGGPGGTTPIDDDSGLQEITTDPDKNGVFKITDKNTQKFKVVSTDGTNTTVQVYSLKELVTETE